MDELTVRRVVREVYGDRAAGCCGSDEGASCGNVAVEPSGLPKLGLGDPVSVAALRRGETVVDLGSGPGRDVLEAARRVGPEGRAIGVDATPEMVFRAREAAAVLKLANAEFRLGEVEHLPIDPESADVVLSDCVVNLSPDKAQVFREALRVLRPGGRIVLSDVVADRELPESVRRDARAWAGCVAGAVREEDYREMLQHAGFVDIRTVVRGGPWAGIVRSAVFVARKPETPS